MAEKIKEEKTEDYKEALAKKEAEEAKRQQEESLKQMKKKQSLAKARREAEKMKAKMEQERFEKRLAECDAEIKKAEEKKENAASYELFGKIGLFASAGLLILALILKVTKAIEIDAMLILLTITLAVLGFSIYFQTLPLFVDAKIRKNNLKKRDLRQAFLKNKNRH